MAGSMIDFGLVVLIWLVQLIIYPGFAYCDRSSFISWHRKYMWLVSFIVAPLMLSQLLLKAYLLYISTDWQTGTSLLLVFLTWIHTFLRAVPLHNKLNIKGNEPALVENLVRINWIRTAAWTVIWLLGILTW